MTNASVVHVGTEFLVNTATQNSQSRPNITSLTNGTFAITWFDYSAGVGGATGDSSGSAVKVQIFAIDGSKIGGEILVNTATINDQWFPKIATIETGGFVVVWEDNSRGNGGATGDNSGTAINEHGSVLGGKTRPARVSSQWKSTPLQTTGATSKLMRFRKAWRCGRSPQTRLMRAHLLAEETGFHA
jgi:hypothetical protein